MANSAIGFETHGTISCRVAAYRAITDGNPGFGLPGVDLINVVAGNHPGDDLNAEVAVLIAVHCTALTMPDATKKAWIESLA